MWLDSLRFGVLRRLGRHPGDYRHVLDIAHVLQEKLGQDTCMYSNQELTARVGKIGFVGFDVLADGDDRGHIGWAEKPSGCSHTHLAGVELGCKTGLGRKSATWPLENDSNIEQRTGQPSISSAALWELSRRPSTSSVASGTTSISRYPSL